MEGPIRSRAGDAGHRAASDPRAGYVLIEAVATLVILTLLMRFAFPSVGIGTTPPRFIALVSASAALLRDARTEAVRRDRPVAVRYDSASRRLGAGAATIAMPPDVAVGFTAGGNCPDRDGAAEIVFRPDGSNCGGILRFSRGARNVRARVNWADGRVDILEGG